MKSLKRKTLTKRIIDSVAVVTTSLIIGCAEGQISSTDAGAGQQATQQSSTPQEAAPKNTETVDPAIAIKPNITYYRDPSLPQLDSEEEYRRGMGDMARVQARMIRDSSQAMRFPSVLIGNGEFTGNCSLGKATVGTYKPQCQSVQVNFTDGTLVYEEPIEVLTVLAHEYAHHLVNISLGSQSISGLENELVADCFAGLMHGYWDKYGKLTEAEVMSAAKMMIQVSKSESLSSADPHGDPGQRVGAFLAGALRTTGQQTAE